MDADFLIAGAGLAGLSLAVALAEAGATATRRVLIVDPRTSFARDRTWCYWDVDQMPHPFAAGVSRRWRRWRVVNGSSDVERSAGGLSYCHLAGDDFYRLALARLARDPNVEIRLGESVEAVDETPDGIAAWLGDGSLVRALHCFDSRPPEAPLSRDRSECFSLIKTKKRPLCSRLIGVPEVSLSQQFVGHFVTTDRPAFDPEVATLMDFRTGPAAGAIRFVYVLPLAENRALVEATTLSGVPVPPAEHEAVIADYLRQIIGVDSWAVTGTERGAISMTTAPRPVAVSRRVWRIGLVGGMAKPSTGYAFLAVQRFSRRAAAIIATHHGTGPLPAPPSIRPGWAKVLDAIFLARLRRRPDLAADLFARLFDRADPAALVRFLSDRATPADVARVVAALPKTPFAAEAVRSWKLWLRPPTRATRPTPPAARPLRKEVDDPAEGVPAF